MTLRIVGIHGVGCYRSRLNGAEAARRISQQWVEALRPALPAGVNMDLRIAYYASFLHDEIAQAAGDGLDWLTTEEYSSLQAWADELGALPPDVAQARWAVPARMIADRIAEQRHLNAILVRPFVATFLREIGNYFRSGTPTRQLVQQLVAEQIRAHRPDIVIAHSLGSVVVYETMWANPDLHADLLITLGSPLAMKAVVFDRLQPQPQRGRGQRPPAIRQWINIADPGDIVAVPRPFTRRFTPDANHDDQHIHWRTFHSVSHYLAARPTVEAISAYLGHYPASAPS